MSHMTDLAHIVLNTPSVGDIAAYMNHAVNENIEKYRPAAGFHKRPLMFLLLATINFQHFSTNFLDFRCE